MLPPHELKTFPITRHKLSVIAQHLAHRLVLHCHPDINVRARITSWSSGWGAGCSPNHKRRGYPIIQHGMPPGRRALRPTPSCPSDISPFQTKLLSDLKKLDEQLGEQRIPFPTWAAKYSSSIAADPERVLREISRLREVVFGDTEADAKTYAQHVLRADSGKTLGLRDTCIVQWRFDAPSMWRGVPDNPRVLKLARSILSSRFRKDSVVASRTLDLSKAADAKVFLSPHVCTHRAL